MTVRIGTSGWSYDHWTEVLYRPGLPAARRLARFVEVFDTVELNASFYRWPKDSTFAGWRERVPDGFTISVKAHRGLTHYRRLNSPSPGSSGSNAAGRRWGIATVCCWFSCILGTAVMMVVSTTS